MSEEFRDPERDPDYLSPHDEAIELDPESVYQRAEFRYAMELVGLSAAGNPTYRNVRADHVSGGHAIYEDRPHLDLEAGRVAANLLSPELDHESGEHLTYPWVEVRVVASKDVTQLDPEVNLEVHSPTDHRPIGMAEAASLLRLPADRVEAVLCQVAARLTAALDTYHEREFTTWLPENGNTALRDRLRDLPETWRPDQAADIDAGARARLLRGRMRDGGRPDGPVPGRPRR